MRSKKTLLFISFLIIFAVIILPYGISKTLAIYRSSSIENGNINTAAWNVSATSGQNNSLNLVSDGVSTQNYTLTVQSSSEVDVDYTIIISNLPSGVEIALDDNNFLPSTNNTITFTRSILYSDTSKVRTHLLKFRSNVGTAEISDREVDIDVIFKQQLQ